MTSEIERPSRLRRWLRANSLFSAASGAGLLVFSRSLPSLLGVGTWWIYAGIGGGLLLYAAHLWKVAGRTPGHAEVVGIVIGDALWVIASLALVIAGVLTTTGVWIVSGVALVIGLFAVMQWRIARRAGSGPLR